MIPWTFLASISLYLIIDGRRYTPSLWPSKRLKSKPWPWANMLQNMNKCDTGGSNFSANFRVVKLKFPLLFFNILQIKKSVYFFYVMCYWLREPRHHELQFSFRSTCVNLFYLFKILYIVQFCKLRHLMGKHTLTQAIFQTLLMCRQSVFPLWLKISDSWFSVLTSPENIHSLSRFCLR